MAPYLYQAGNLHEEKEAEKVAALGDGFCFRYVLDVLGTFHKIVILGTIIGSTLVEE